jgi:molybdate transport system substrate-binding protein
LQVKTRIQSGEFADVTILNRPQIESLLQQKKVAANSIVDFARSGVGMAVRTGAPKPDISTVEAFKHTLLAAKSISYPDPARGGLSGTHLMRVFERLGITEDMKRKTKFPPPGVFPAALIASGEVEIGMTQPMEFYAEPRVQFVGWLPAELQNPAEFSFAAAIPTTAKEFQAAEAFIRFLVGPSASAVFRAKGMDTRMSERKP